MTRGVGELSVALAWWLVVLGADYVQRRGFFLIPALTALSFAVLAANIFADQWLSLMPPPMPRWASAPGGAPGRALRALYLVLALLAPCVAGGDGARWTLPQRVRWGVASAPWLWRLRRSCGAMPTHRSACARRLP